VESLSHLLVTSLVSVVIPTKDRREFVAEAVRSVLEQSVTEWELVVVDDGSTDGTVEHLQRCFRDPRVRIVPQENRGVSAARNRGVRETRGRWIAFLDSDDLWLPTKLERQLQVLSPPESAPACYTEEVWYRRGRWANPRNVHAKHDGWIFRQCLPLCIVSPSSAMLSREVFEKLGGFDESLPACEDYELWLRLTARYSVRLVPERLIVKRNGHAGQLSQAHWGMDRFRVRALWGVVLDAEVQADQRRLALETLVQKAEIVAQGAEKRGHPERARTFRHSRDEAIRWLQEMSGDE